MPEKIENHLDLSPGEIKEAQHRSSVTPHVVHEAVRREGEQELHRSISALAWSGLAAGLSMGFSLITEGLLRHALPDAPWRPAVTKLGYSSGFLLVILGRQQLFTENTLTPMLPLFHKRDAATAKLVGRLWGVVLTANLVGALIVALTLARTGVFPPEIRSVFAEIGLESMSQTFGQVVLRGVFAGWLIAMLVWMLPFAETARFFVIVMMTWLIGFGAFSHVVAGAVDVLFLAGTGGATWQAAVGGYILPALIGNILGGVALVAVVNHAQVVS
ncbi:MAG TPA: formate/nitrite transporter family protein [Bryobacteraceae bacterium]|nr:formate/nitrite transporter family protein [Bryobacteraceae bacterium]